jgi:hypothetical protein
MIQPLAKDICHHTKQQLLPDGQWETETIELNVETTMAYIKTVL